MDNGISIPERPSRYIVFRNVNDNLVKLLNVDTGKFKIGRKNQCRRADDVVEYEALEDSDAGQASHLLQQRLLVRSCCHLL